MIPATGIDLYHAGASIIPVRPDKTPHVAWSRYQRSRAEWDQLAAWDHEFHPAAWAVVTGTISGIVVLDFDGEPGVDTMERLRLEPHVGTGSGGFHIYVEHPGEPVRTVSGKAAREFGERFPGLDVRGDGGYAIFAGRNQSGVYVTLRSPVPPERFDHLPEDLRAAILRRPAATPNGDTASAITHPAPPTCDPDLAMRLLDRALELATTEGRNNAGFWLCTQARDNGFPKQAAEMIVRAYAEQVPPSTPRA